MSPEEKRTYMDSQIACALIEMESMKAMNYERDAQGLAQAYNEEAFLDLIEKYGIHHNAVIGWFHD